MIDQREDQIRQRAYEMWEQEGCPEGREHAHWDEAARQIGAASNGESPSPKLSEASRPSEAGGSIPSGNPTIDQLTPSQATSAVTGARAGGKNASSGSEAEAKTRKPL